MPEIRQCTKDNTEYEEFLRKVDLYLPTIRPKQRGDDEVGKSQRGHKLTRKQKIILSNATPRLQPDNWLYIGETDDSIIIEHKVSGNRKSVKKNG